VIDHGAEDFPFEQLAAILRERIRSGEYPPGSKIPPLTALEAETGLAVTTIRRAIRLLTGEGLLRTKPGRGTFVTGSS
jgi:GntR family transcriptional regulator